MGRSGAFYSALGEVEIEEDDEARAARDNLAMVLYNALFEELVRGANAALVARSAPRSDAGAAIDIIDCAGFEDLKVHNGLDQLCANYANEQMLQLFHDHCFKEPERQYVEQGIQHLCALDRRF